MRTAVIGAGIAGVACARVLQHAGEDVVVLDRGRVVGGRMASRRFHGRYTDLGASYFTVQDSAFGEAVASVAVPWTDSFHRWEDGALRDPRPGPMRWAAPGGLRSVVAALAEGLEIRHQVHVSSVTPGAVDGERFDRVVLAMPDPQALAILTDPVDRAVLEDRAWDPVLVLAARWEERCWDWQGVFVHGSDVLSWVADDGSRRGDGAPVLTAHSTPVFAATRLAVPADAAAELVAGLTAVGLPEPVEVLRVQRWTYAKPVGERPEMFSLSSRGIGFCGDGWGRSRIEAAWLSGNALGHALLS